MGAPSLQELLVERSANGSLTDPPAMEGGCPHPPISFHCIVPVREGTFLKRFDKIPSQRGGPAGRGVWLDGLNRCLSSAHIRHSPLGNWD